jgi:hypothetical protein
MSTLKPIGSEKLQGQDKIKRIMEIARFKEVTPNPLNETAKSEYKINLADGNNYQIVKERQGYIIKKTISESETDYIEPMKNRKYYSSYSQAFKRLNLLAGELNRLNENEEGVTFFGEQKKFVLKTPKPEVEAPAAPLAEPPAVPSPELPPSPMGDEMGGEEMPPEDMGGEEMPPEDMGGEEMGAEVDVDVEEPSSEDDDMVTFKSIQKLTGKLTQKIRTLDNQEGMTSEDIKYVINMVLSSLDLASLSEEDKEDILSKFEDIESDEEMGDMGGEEIPAEDDITSDTEVEDIQADMDVPVEGEASEDYGMGAIIDSIFGESKVDKVISKYFEVSKKEILENRERNIKKKKVNLTSQMREVKNLSETIEQELASQKFLEENLSAKIVGKTNKKNLVFEHKGEQIKISPKGMLL